MFSRNQGDKLTISPTQERNKNQIARQQSESLKSSCDVHFGWLGSTSRVQRSPFSLSPSMPQVSLNMATFTKLRIYSFLGIVVQILASTCIKTKRSEKLPWNFSKNHKEFESGKRVHQECLHKFSQSSFEIIQNFFHGGFSSFALKLLKWKWVSA